MNILKRDKITHATVMPGDTISLGYVDENGTWTEHLATDITKHQTFDEVIIFEDVIEGKNALGGAWLEAK